MAHVVVLGAGLGGLPAAFELRKEIGRGVQITIINDADSFFFIPSNPWVAVGWRKPEQISVPLRQVLARKNIDLIVDRAERVDPEHNTVVLGGGRGVSYDYLLIATGAKLAFDEIPGFGPDRFTQSVCTVDHSLKALTRYQAFLKDPGPVVVGAAQGASCFGPAYETAMIIDADLRKRRIRDRVPITFVTSEPYVGHLGLGGVSDSRGMLESTLRKRDIKFIPNAKFVEAREDAVIIQEHTPDGKPWGDPREIASSLRMVIPAFKGVDAVAAAPEICNPRGFVKVDRYQRNDKFTNLYAAGVCVAIAPPDPTPVPTGVPKSGYMIESMVSTAVANIKAAISGQEGNATGTWNAICLADLGDTGMAFVALPQIPPRNVVWAGEGKWVHLAKIGFEKYFLRKMRKGSSEPVYERWVLKRLGITRIRKESVIH
ncbi:MAG TPA: FAD-dependent oxidoreductase [Spirochaetia bacterium]|nr:FAD-dependent oxidoreductase [Spirochaetia bacterium]